MRKEANVGKDRHEEDKRRGFQRRSKKSTAVADWQAVNAELLVRAIATVSLAGGALRFGYSRDGGAYALGIYSEGEHHTEFTADTAEVEEILSDLCEWFTGGAAVGVKP